MAHWARYRHQGTDHFGQLEGESIKEYEGDMFASAKPTGGSVKLSEVELLPPVVPSKIVALAHNSHSLIQKMGGQVPDEPMYLLKANSSLHPTGKPIRRPKAYEGKVIFEGELGLVIGKTCRDVDEDSALDYLFGCTCINDVTSIELLNKSPVMQQWVRSKAADTYGVVGPVVATDLDPDTLTIRSVLDGQERQNYSVSDFVFSPAQIISSLSGDMTLLPGDVIACGTSVGAGSMKPGSTIEITIDGIGTLSNTFEG
ncbi:MAG: fumarylacetoacetate hydrolase family protein [Gammaproteobacteria bacterium]|nr:fumarylacetoacetate hydrolase family protein [Gammaproteobacteria bacterium]